MRQAAVLSTPADALSNPLHIETLSTPALYADEVIIEVSACGVCRTDLQICEGDLAPRHLPIVPGHQIVGKVTAVGSAVAQHRIGDRVGVSWLAGTCGQCRFCQSGRENLCERATFTGWDRDGGYATHTVANASYVYPLPAQYSDVEIAPLLCGGVIGYRCLHVAGVTEGTRLGLYGFGSSATTVLQLALNRGCHVAVVTRSEGERRRADRLGAHWSGGYDEQPPWPLDAAITFAPVGDVVISALRAVDRGGTVVINAIHLDHIPEFDYGLLWWERSLKSVANFTRADAAGFLAEAATTTLSTTTDTYGLADANRALADLREGRVRASAVIAPG